MLRHGLIPKHHRIRAQLLVWTSILLLVAIAGPLELRRQVAARFLEQDLADRTAAIVSDMAANFGEFERLPEDAAIEQQLLTEIVKEPSIVELSVFGREAGGEHRVVASSVSTPDFTLDNLGPVSLKPRPIGGLDGERLIVLGRTVPKHPSITVVAVTTLKDLDRFASVNRRWAFVFTLGSIGIALVMLNLIFQTKIGRPVEDMLAVISKARSGDYAQRIPEARDDEIGEIAASFNDLLDRVKSRTEEINRLNKELQGKVYQATADLTRKNEELQKTAQDLLEVQNRLIQAERLAMAGQMAATFAHEIGSPLSSLSAHTEMLLEDPDATAQQKEAAALMHKQIQRVTQIVDDLLRSARRGPEDFVPVDIVEILNDVVNLVAPTLRAQNIEVVRDLPPAAYVRGYALYLQEVFLNLIKNAADAMECNGRVELAGGFDRDGKAWIEVRDNGPGVDPKIIDDVWKHFVTTKGMRNGAGLGLAVVREIVRQHGGEVVLESSPFGTTVRVTLPALKSQTIPA